MLVNMAAMLKEAVSQNKIVPGFNIFGYEDAVSVIRAAEELNAPVILMTNKDAVDFMDVKHMAKLLGSLAESSETQVCVHLDHAKDFELIKKAVEAGYTSVMYDGSQLSLEENMENTKKIVQYARRHYISVEAEIGSVAYSENPDIKGIYTEPDEAEIFAKETEVDALAVAVGTLHRMQAQEAVIQYDRLKAIKNCVEIPLVIHGTTGVKDSDLKEFAKYNIGKVNIGTALRMAFGKTLREEILNRSDEFDRVKLFKKPMQAVKEAVIEKYKLLGW